MLPYKVKPLHVVKYMYMCISLLSQALFSLITRSFEFLSCVPVTTQARSSVVVIMAGQSESRSEGQSWCFYVCGDVKECFVVSAAIVSAVVYFIVIP